jgi:hypothetical protein
MVLKLVCVYHVNARTLVSVLKLVWICHASHHTYNCIVAVLELALSRCVTLTLTRSQIASFKSLYLRLGLSGHANGPHIDLSQHAPWWPCA